MGQDGNDYNKHELKSTVIYSYDSQNREIKRCYIDVYHPLDNCVLYKYNRNNFLEENMELTPDKNKSTNMKTEGYLNWSMKNILERSFFKTEVNFRYEFDSQGNWTKQTKIINGVPLYEE